MGPLGFWAIEVKNADRIFSADLRALRSFKEDYPEVVPLLLYRGKESMVKEGVLCIPCEQFLKALTPNCKLPV
jgi:hypothetical protein